LTRKLSAFLCAFFVRRSRSIPVRWRTSTSIHVRRFTVWTRDHIWRENRYGSVTETKSWVRNGSHGGVRKSPVWPELQTFENRLTSGTTQCQYVHTTLRNGQVLRYQTYVARANLDHRWRTHEETTIWRFIVCWERRYFHESTFRAVWLVTIRNWIYIARVS
jgi:hypothetical protein